MPRRTWGASEQKRSAAAQEWKCAMCGCMLPAEFELDHIIPLFEGGKDCYLTNSQALCPNCHASKTQLESIRRRDLRAQKRLEAIETARRVDEQRIWAEEQSKRTEIREASGARRCELCHLRYYPMFTHHCREVKERVQQRLYGSPRSCHIGSKRSYLRFEGMHAEDSTETTESHTSNPFLQFTHVPYSAERSEKYGSRPSLAESL